MGVRHLIYDKTGELWSDDSEDSFETGSAIIAAVNDGNEAGYSEHIGKEWQGDLVLVRELARTC